jgi:alkanesulfonate monooxygenase SsuD/methylene tetrahydromethanopterin reductase-like flavin-dependent oxidoreductase (luciferase family)
VKRLQKLCDYATNPNIALVSGFMCAPTDEEAQRKADGWTFFSFALRFYNAHGPVAPGTVDLWKEYQAYRATPEGQKAMTGGLIGSPATLRKRLAAFEDSHIDQVILLNQAGKNTHEDICSSLELFAKDVMPEFQAHEPAHQEWKRRVLAGEIELPDAEANPEAEKLETAKARGRA